LADDSFLSVSSSRSLLRVSGLNSGATLPEIKGFEPRNELDLPQAGPKGDLTPDFDRIRLNEAGPLEIERPGGANGSNRAQLQAVDAEAYDRLIDHEPEILTWARILYYLGVTELLSGRRLVSPPTVRYLSVVPVR